jgi:hypothetical protein
LADAQHLPEGRRQAGDRHFKFHDARDNLLLRRGGVIVAATVAGVSAVEALNAADAHGAPGDPLVLGQANDSGTAATSLTSGVTTAATFTVANTGARAPVGLASQSGALFVAVAGGELANLDGLLYSTLDFGGTIGVFPGFVYTEFTANQVVTIVPHRILDTRTSTGRAQILNTAGNLDSSGRLLAGHTINIDLSTLESAAASAFCNLTAVSPLTGGFMTLFPGGTRPGTSSINFTKGAIIANFAVTGTSSTDTVSIYSAATSHVLLDITAFNVGSPAQINPNILPPSASSATSQQLAARAKAGTLPDWYSGSVSR